MPTEDTEVQESTQAETTIDTTDTQSEATTTASPAETDGASSSDAAVDAKDERTVADHIRDEFLKKYGDPDEPEEAEADTEDTPEDTAEKAEEPAKAETPKDKPEENISDDGDDEFRLSDKEFKALPEGARKRIGHLNARAKKAEREVEEVRGRVEAVEKDASSLQTLRSFAKENHFEPDDVSLAFQLMADLRNGRYSDFLQRATPIFQQAQILSGQSLPEDLQQSVDDGYLTEEHAKELAQARAQKAEAETRAKRAEGEVTQTRQADQARTRATEIISATQAREAELMKSDADYARLEPTIQRIMQSFLQYSIPQSKEDAVAMVNEAYQAAKEMAPAKAAPKDTHPSPGSTQTSTPRGTDRPTATDPRAAVIDALVDYKPGQAA